jgi:hypothetical protein
LDVFDASESLFHHRVRHLHRLGPWHIGEVLAEIVARFPQAEPVIADRLANYGDMDPDVVALVGANDWLDQRQLVRAVVGAGS